MSNYITEAFKRFNLLEEVEDIPLNAAGIEELRSFMDEAGVDPDDEVIEIYDLEAQAEDELKQSYLGKAILECKVCHSYIFEDRENIGMDLEGNCCTDIECPYCLSTDGFIVIGEVAPYNKEESEELLADPEEESEDLQEVDVEGAADDVDEEDLVEESLDDQEADDDEHKDEAEEKIDEGIIDSGKKALKAGVSAAIDSVKSDILGESCEDKIDEACQKEELEEEMKLDGVEELYDNDEIRGVEELEGSDKMEGSEDIEGDKHKDPINEGCEDKVEESCDSKKMDESIEDVSVTTEDEVMTMATKDDGGVVIETTPKDDFMGTPEELSGEEMIVPMSDDSEVEVEAAIDANSIEDGEEDDDFASIENEMAEEEFPIDEFEEFDEESFNGLGESYLKSCYENVTGFKTSNVSSKDNKLFIEGVIKFDSGNEKKTNFVFESVGDYKFEGYNEQISRGKKTFKLTGSMNDKKLVCESLNYNYRSKNELNESVRVYGTVKRK